MALKVPSQTTAPEAKSLGRPLHEPGVIRVVVRGSLVRRVQAQAWLLKVRLAAGAAAASVFLTAAAAAYRQWKQRQVFYSLCHTAFNIFIYSQFICCSRSSQPEPVFHPHTAALR